MASFVSNAESVDDAPRNLPNSFGVGPDEPPPMHFSNVEYSAGPLGSYFPPGTPVVIGPGAGRPEQMTVQPTAAQLSLHASPDGSPQSSAGAQQAPAQQYVAYVGFAPVDPRSNSVALPNGAQLLPLAATAQAAQMGAVAAALSAAATAVAPTLQLQQQNAPRVRYEQPGHAAPAQQPEIPGPKPGEPDDRTTMMLRHIPHRFTQQMLLQELEERGFKGKYDFLYLPIDFSTRRCMGYAFINFVDTDTVEEFKKKFDRQRMKSLQAQKPCEVVYARVQGLAANVEVYRNSPVNGVPIKQYRPLIFDTPSGAEKEFPGPDAPLPPVQLRNEAKPDKRYGKGQGKRGASWGESSNGEGAMSNMSAYAGGGWAEW